MILKHFVDRMSEGILHSLRGGKMKKMFFLSLLLFPSIILADIAVTLPASSYASSSTGDVFSFGRWVNSSSGFKISWNITQSGANYNYIYSISGKTGGSLSRGLDTFILQLNPSITPTNISTVITNVSANVVSSLGPQTFTPGDSNSSNYPYLPGSIYGILVDFGSVNTTTFSFTSSYAPVWGSFYADNGEINSNRGYAYNASFGITPTVLSDLTNYIPTVGGPSVLAPEPSTMLIMGTGLALIIYLKRRKENTFTAV